MLQEDNGREQLVSLNEGILLANLLDAGNETRESGPFELQVGREVAEFLATPA